MQKPVISALPLILSLLALTATFIAGGYTGAAQSPRAVAGGGELLLVENGEARACVVLPDEPTTGEVQAAEQLRIYVRKMSGADMTLLRPSQNPTGDQVRLGRACGKLQNEATVEDGFTIQTGQGVLNIKGVNERGTFYGVCDLLEHLGVRWFLPGELGEVVPRRATIALGPLAYKQEPSIPIRWIGKGGQWPPHARSNVLAENEMGVRINGSFHTFHQFMPAEKYCDQHPEWFALVNGKRVYNREKPQLKKLCTSNPDMAREFIRNCRALCEPGFPTAAEVNRQREKFPNWKGALTRPHMLFYKQVAEALRESHPRVKVMVGAYSAYLWPPHDAALKYPDNVYVMVTHGICHNHALADEACELNREFQKTFEGWSNRAPGGLFIYEYYNKLANVECPFPILHTIRRDIPYYHHIGVKGFFTQYGAGCWTTPLRFYVASRLLWDVNADVDALLDDYYVRFWGPAGRAMRAFDERLERAALDYGTHLFTPPFKLPLLFTDAVLAACATHLEAAGKAADSDLLRRRVAKIRLSFQWTAMSMDYVKEIRWVAREVDGQHLSAKELARRLAVAQSKSDALRKFIHRPEGRDVFAPSTNYIQRFLRPAHVFGDRIAQPDDAPGE